MDPIDFYHIRSEKLQVQRSTAKNRLRLLSVLRLSTFLAGGTIIYLLWGNWVVILPVFIAEVIVFLVLVSRYTNLKNDLNFIDKQLELNENEICIINGGENLFSNGKEFLSSEHYYNQDLDLFGKNSLFGVLNRTTSTEGGQILADKLNSNDLGNISDKQEALRELALRVEWRQEFGARALLANPEIKLKILVNWIKNYVPFTSRTHAILPLIFGSFSFVVLTLFSLDFVGFPLVLIWLIIGLGIVGTHLTRTNKLYLNATKAQEVFKQYSKILEQIEQTNFQTDQLKGLQMHFRSNQNNASGELEKFSKLTDYLGNRNNIFLTVILNGFFLWDLVYSRKIEQWLESNNIAIEAWVDVIHEFDALNSLANYVYNHPHFTFPSIENDDTIINATQLGHPLISEDKNVRNDAKISDKNFFIITGANMAGKSTFLRTIGLSIVMANTGLPVNSKEFKYKPVRLVSSMRTSDSLADDESYFFSELKRLKFIVDIINERDYFIILDEILKGTNSKDKAEGSQKFLEKLVDSGSTGLIATHDLSLCDISNKYDQVKNFYFDAEIENDELSFDYKMKVGICKNMNASFLLKKMKIV